MNDYVMTIPVYVKIHVQGQNVDEAYNNAYEIIDKLIHHDAIGEILIDDETTLVHTSDGDITLEECEELEA